MLSPTHTVKSSNRGRPWVRPIRNFRLLGRGSDGFRLRRGSRSALWTLQHLLPTSIGAGSATYHSHQGLERAGQGRRPLSYSIHNARGVSIQVYQTDRGPMGSVWRRSASSDSSLSPPLNHPWLMCRPPLACPRLQCTGGPAFLNLDGLHSAQHKPWRGALVANTSLNRIAKAFHRNGIIGRMLRTCSNIAQ